MENVKKGRVTTPRFFYFVLAKDKPLLDLGEVIEQIYSVFQTFIATSRIIKISKMLFGEGFIITEPVNK